MLHTTGNLLFRLPRAAREIGLGSLFRSNVFYLRDQKQGQMSRLFFASEIKIYAVPVSVYSKTITRGRESGLAKPPVCNCVDKLGTQKQTDPTLFVFDLFAYFENNKRHFADFFLNFYGVFKMLTDT